MNLQPRECCRKILQRKSPLDALRLDIAPEDAILRQASLGNYNLIVMGVGRPAGETLFFGRVAAAVLENSDRSLFFV
jgi:nucleotide-binding universal stress UspA family protein